MKQEIFTEKNLYFTFCLHHSKKILFVLMILLLGIPLLVNVLQGNVLITGTESYYHLYESNNVTIHNLYVIPISILTMVLPGQWASIIPLIFAICSLLFVFSIQNKLKIQQKYFFLFVIFFVISPAFIYTFSTISAYAVYTFLVLSGFVLLTHNSSYIKPIAFFPFILATTIDILSTSIVLCSVFVYYITKINKRNALYTTLFIILGIMFIVNLFFHQPFIIGPFHVEQIVPDLISDLGGISGVSFFLVLLSMMGITFLWKMKQYSIYIITLFIGISYCIHTQSIFYVSIIVGLFATVAFTRTFERKWELQDVKKIAFFVFFLGLAFSTLTYIDRIDQIGPLTADNEVLTWIKVNTPQNSIVFSTAENSEYIRYIAERTPFNSFSQDATTQDVSASILNSTYIHELFPLLENNNITLIYINKKMKEEFDQEQGFTFLLKNERFKLAHSHEESEVWAFTKEYIE